MVVATCTLKLQLAGARSLKEKRQVVKSICARVGREFNVAVAEVDYHEVWQTAGLGLVTVGTDAGRLHGQLEQMVNWIQSQRPDTYVDDYRIEFR